MFVPSFCSSWPDCAASLLFAKVLALRVLLFFFSCRGAASPPLPLPVLVLMLRFACSSSFSCSSCYDPQKQACYEWVTHLKTTHFSCLSWVHRFHSLSGIHGPLISRPLKLGAQVSYRDWSIILLLLLLFVGVDASCEIPGSDAIACLPPRAGHIGVHLGVQHTINYLPHTSSPSSVPSPAIFNHTSLSSIHPIHRLCHRYFSLCSVSSSKLCTTFSFNFCAIFSCQVSSTLCQCFHFSIHSL